MKTLKVFLTLTVVMTILIFTSCSKEQELLQNLSTVQEEVSHFDETNSEALTWDQLPAELRDAKPLNNDADEFLRSCSYNSQSGSWGGNGGSPFNYNPSTCHRIYAVAIKAGSRVDRLVVWYKSKNGTIYVGLDEGGNGGTYYFQLFSSDGSEFIRKVAGRAGSRIDRLSIYTNKKSFSYGGNGGTYFAFQPPYGTRIRGFHGRSGNEINRIGFYGYAY